MVKFINLLQSEVNEYYAKLHLQSIEYFEEFFFNKTYGLDMALNYTRKLLPRIKKKTLNEVSFSCFGYFSFTTQIVISLIFEQNVDFDDS